MQRYKNLGSDSGVVAYEIGKDYIIVEFVDGHSYLYDHSQPGKEKVESMKQFALAGTGLATFINKYVRGNYARKLS
jgi:hypothetical protein